MTPTTPGMEAADRHIGLLAASGCIALLICKLILIRRININWDEFHFLSDVYALQRGDLGETFQGAYTHLFTWLTRIGEDEVTQIFVGRLVMLACLAVTSWGIWQLARRWTSRGIALVAPLCYLSMLSVVVHGASFRYDPMLAMLSVFVLLLLSRTSSPRWTMAGICMGVATAISVKAVLLLPVGGALALANIEKGPRPYHDVLRNGARFFFAAVLTSGVLLWAHSFFVTPAETTGTFLGRSFRQTLVEGPLFPRAEAFHQALGADPITWFLLGSGFLVSLAHSRYRAAVACALSLIPIIFYRNSFPYYYVVMLAPACVLAAVLVDFTYRYFQPRASAIAVSGLTSMVVVVLAGQGALHVYDCRFDDVSYRQRTIIEAVHQIFPTPVPYIDHGGMISSFRKANFFMSSWGIQRYVTNGKRFMPDAIRLHRPPLLVANRPILQPEHPFFRNLLPEDQQLINEFYLPYWGPVRIAGGTAALHQDEEAIIKLPFPGKYRIETTGSITVDNAELRNGDIVDVGHTSKVSIRALSQASGGTQVRLLWAAARKPPATLPPHQLIYLGL